MTPVGRMVLDRNPDNFFAETEQVAFGVQNLVPGHRLLERPAPRGAHPLLLRHPAPAARRAELPRDSRSTRRSRRRTTTSGTASTGRPFIAAAWPTSPTRSAAAVRFRRACADSRAFPRRSRTTRSAESPRSSRTTTRRPRCSGTARRPTRRRTSSGASASSSPRCRCPRFASARSPCSATSRTNSRRRWPTAWAFPCLDAMPRVIESATSRGHDLAGAVAHRPPRRRQHPGAQGRDPRRAGRRGGLRHPHAGVRCPRRARWFGCSAARLGAVERRRRTSSPMRPSRPCRRCCSTRWSSPMGRGGRRAERPRACARIPQGPVPARQADPDAGSRRAGGGGRRRTHRTSRTGRSCATSRPSSMPWASTATGTAPPIRRACDPTL